MKVRVSRTSEYNDNSPCDGAYKEVEEIKLDSGDVYHIIYWYIDIELSEIGEFIKKYGKIIIGIDTNGKYYIEIYDEWRE